MEPVRWFAKNWEKSLQSLYMFSWIVTSVIGLAGCAHFGRIAPEPVTVPQIVKMAQEGIPADVIIARLKASGTVYRLKASQLATLEDAGVPATVIDYMQQTYLDAVKTNSRYDDLRFWGPEDEFGWYGGAPYGWPDADERREDD